MTGDVERELFLVIATAPRVSIGKLDEVLMHFLCQVMQHHREISARSVDIVVKPRPMFGTEGFDSTRDILVRKDVALCDVIKYFLVGDVVCRLCCRHLDKIELNTRSSYWSTPRPFTVSPGPAPSLVNLAMFVALVILAYAAYFGAMVELPVFADPARTLEQSV